MPAGTLSIDFIANTAGLESGVRGAKLTLSGFEQSVNSSGMSLGKFTLAGMACATTMKAIDGAASLVRGTLSGIADMVSTGIGLAADAEQAQISFEVMLGSVSKAKSMLAEIRSFAAATPFESPELIKAAKTLLAMGISAKETVPTLRMLGDVAAGTGIPIGNLAAMYGKMSAAGRVMNDDLRQLSENGVPAVKMLAKAMGVPTTEIRKMAEQGKISFDYLRNALIDLTSAGGQFENMTARQSQTLSGLASTLKDNVGLAMMDLGQTVTDAFQLKSATAALAGNVDLWKGMLQAFAESSAAALGPLVGVSGSWEEVFAGMTQTAVPAMALLADGIQASVQNLMRLKIAALEVMKSAQKFALWATTPMGEQDSWGYKMQQSALDLGFNSEIDKTGGQLAGSMTQGSAGDKLAQKLSDILDKFQKDKTSGAAGIPAPPALPKANPKQQLPTSLAETIFPMATAIGRMIGKGLAAAKGAGLPRTEWGGADTRKDDPQLPAALIKGSRESYSYIAKATARPTDKQDKPDKPDKPDANTKAVEAWFKRFWDFINDPNKNPKLGRAKIS